MVQCVFPRVILTNMMNFPAHEYMLLNESLWNDKCDYVSPDSCTNLNPNNHNLIVLQLNIRELISHKTDLHQLLNTLKLKNSTVDVVLLCETFLNGTTVKQVHIPGYTLYLIIECNIKGSVLQY